ncbi:MAG: hypothetical protein E6713_03060 [Sporomusaceae bacterium]|nr:hypothetical protein [Sporomusaceae bacterium]
MTNLSKKQQTIVAAVLIVLIGIGGYLFYKHEHHPQVVTGESQHQAESTGGVDLAAKNAHIKMLQAQLKDAADQIAVLKNKPPLEIVRTVPAQVSATVEQQRQAAKADFAIVTDPKNPDKVVDLKQVEQLPANTPVTLNQYNVQAFKPTLHQLDIIPDWSSTVKGSPKLAEVDYGESHKVSSDGKYFGWKAGYDIKHSEVKAGITYTF